MKTGGNNIINWPMGQLDFTKGCILMGVLNVTPDSFSDGGKYLQVDKAVEKGIQMVKEGAAIIDVGAESTRPGSKGVESAEQIKRAIPVIEELTKKIDVPVSIDTSSFEVAKTALDYGAAIINDITALNDNRMAELAVKKKTPVVLMHMQGDPSTMQTKPTYDNVLKEVLAFLLGRAAKAEGIGISREMIFIDPGIGFGKTLEHNILLLKNIKKFVDTGYRVLVGTSRKRFIGELTAKKEPADRVFGTAATVAHCVASGVSIVRVHDVAEMVDVVKVANALKLEPDSY